MKTFYFGFLLVLFSLFGLPAAAQTSKIDSLIKLVAEAKADTTRINLLNELANQSWGTDPEKVKLYAGQALRLAQLQKYTNGIIKSYINLGNYYRVRNQNKQALPYYDKALAFALQTNNKKDVAIIYIRMGTCYEYLGNYPLALEHALNGLKLGEQIQSKLIQAKALNSIGDIMRRQKKYPESLSYFRRAIPLFAFADKIGEAYALSNIGVVYGDTKQHHKAIDYVEKSLRIFDSFNHLAGQTTCYNTLGENYAQLAQNDKALYYFKQSLSKSLPKGYTTTAALAMQGMARIYLRSRQPAEAVKLYQQSLQLAFKEDLAEEKLVAYQGLTEAYTQQKNLEQALHYQNKLLAFKDSLFNHESTQKIAQLQADYQLEKKQAEIELLKKDQERDDLVRNTTIAGLLGTLLIGTLLFSRQRLKINQAKEVAQKNAQLALQAEALEQQAKKLQELDQVKSNFFANISHEFRTPLTLILGSLTDKIIQLEQTAPASFIWVGGKEIKIMQRNAQRLLDLINQLLDLSKLDSGQLSLTLQTGELGHFFRMLVSSFTSIAQYRKINFTLFLPDAPLLFLFDADKLEKIFGNLLSNAFKFTPDGGQISLHVALVPDTTWLVGSVVQVTLQDNGRGIAVDQLDKVFDRFYQGNNHHYSDQQGTGIGLALVKELVQLHQGKVWAEANPQQGTCFVVQLPLEPVTTAIQVEESFSVTELLEPVTDTAPLLPDNLLPVPSEIEEPKVDAKTSAPSAKEDKPLILIVEDNADLRHYIRQHLQASYRVLESENGKQGLGVAIARVPDLIISDLMMPEMDGLELCAQIKTNELTSHIPFVLLTALATSESKLEGLKNGADDYLIKPFHAQELQVRVHNLIQTRQKLRARFGKEVRLQPKDIAVTSTDEKFLEKALKVVEDNLSNPDFGAEEFSSELAMSRMQLHRKLTALTNQSTSDFLRTMRLKRAAQLLTSRAGNVSEIAYQVGFNSVSYFAKCFREQFGVSANQYLVQLEPQPEE